MRFIGMARPPARFAELASLAGLCAATAAAELRCGCATDRVAMAKEGTTVVVGDPVATDLHRCPLTSGGDPDAGCRTGKLPRVYSGIPNRRRS